MKKIIHQYVYPATTLPNGKCWQRVVSFWNDGSMTADYYVESGGSFPMQIYQGGRVPSSDALPYLARWAND